MPAGDLNLWATSWLAQMIAKVAAMKAGYKKASAAITLTAAMKAC